MKKTKHLLIGAACLFFVFSCQDEGVEYDESIMTKASGERAEDELALYWDDIDGGTLPGVTVTGESPCKPVQFSTGPTGGMGHGGGGGGDFWGTQWGGSSTEPWWTAGGGGGGSSSSGGVISNFPENLIKRFPKGSTLDANAMTKLNSVYRMVVEVECMYEVIDEYIGKSGKNTGKLSAESEHPIYGISASVDKNWNLTFYGNAINGANLKHEWIHLFQMACNSEMDPNDNHIRGMMEFELSLIQDITLCVRYGVDKLYDRSGTEYEDSFSWTSNMETEGKDVLEKEYKKWLNTICKDNQLLVDHISSQDFLYWAKVFKEKNRSYGSLLNGYDFSNDKKYQMNINYFFNMLVISGCVNRKGKLI